MTDRKIKQQKVDFGLSALLVVQALTLFVAVPLGTTYHLGHILFDICHLAFALVCVAFLTRHRLLQLGLLLALGLLAIGPIAGDSLMLHLGLPVSAWYDAIAYTAFAFNVSVATLVTRHVFGPGRVTVHRVRGAVLLYLNVAALFAILYSMIETHWPGAIAPSGGGTISNDSGVRIATLTYFSLTTITTTGYGDLAPVHPLVRALANLESVFGQLFPATLLARIVALHLAHDANDSDSSG